MELDELLASDKLLLTPDEISVVMGANPQTIRMGAHDGTLGFPVCVMGSRVRIPRIPFLRFLGLEVPSEPENN